MLPLVLHRDPYLRLYRVIILGAVQDLARKQHQNEARQWPLSFESDYAFARARIGPHSVREQMPNTMKFQVKWRFHEVELSQRKREVAPILLCILD